MSVRIRIGGVWLTGGPTERQGVHSSAASPAFSAMQHMQMLTGPDWPAQRPMDLMQRAVTMSFSFSRQFATPAAMGTWLADTLSAAPTQSYQDDAVVRWTHLDGVGYSESLLPWAALRIHAILHDGPTTVRMDCSMNAGELLPFAVLDQPHWLWEDGESILWEDSAPMLLEVDEYWLTRLYDAVLWEDGYIMLTEEGLPWTWGEPVQIF